MMSGRQARQRAASVSGVTAVILVLGLIWGVGWRWEATVFLVGAAIVATLLVRSEATPAELAALPRRDPPPGSGESPQTAADARARAAFTGTIAPPPEYFNQPPAVVGPVLDESVPQSPPVGSRPGDLFVDRPTLVQPPGPGRPEQQ